jgi:uncharacterized protein (DUF488 family)
VTTAHTIGHGARSADEFLETLLGARIDVVLDVRRFPGSRRHPHFGRAEIERRLAGVAVGYEWWGEELGGRRRASVESRHTALRVAALRAFADHMDSPEFAHALARVHERAARERIALMCAETLWWRCHRRMISDALALAGVEVVHLISPAQRQAHKLHDTVRLDGRGRPTYDAGAATLGAREPSTTQPGASWDETAGSSTSSMRRI